MKLNVWTTLSPSLNSWWRLWKEIRNCSGIATKRTLNKHSSLVAHRVLVPRDNGSNPSGGEKMFLFAFWVSTLLLPFTFCSELVLFGCTRLHISENWLRYPSGLIHLHPSVATRTCTICRGVWKYPNKFHLYLIFIITSKEHKLKWIIKVLFVKMDIRVVKGRDWKIMKKKIHPKIMSFLNWMYLRGENWIVSKLNWKREKTRTRQNWKRRWQKEMWLRLAC